MVTQPKAWLDTLLEANAAFQQRRHIDQLPVQRQPCPYAIITCMDPRVNLEAFGIPPFAADGAARSQVRVIRTIGAMSDSRSLIIGIHMAGFKEIALIGHTDCGGGLAFERIDTIVNHMQNTLRDDQWRHLQEDIGEPFRANLMKMLKVFQDPREAVKAEIQLLRQQPFIPDELILHGLLYELATGRLEVVVDGYTRS
jgi:carbonic anhydrase